MKDLKQNPCPKCGFYPLLHKRKNKFYYKCDGECWTQTAKYYSADRALEAWNKLSKE